MKLLFAFLLFALALGGFGLDTNNDDFWFDFKNEGDAPSSSQAISIGARRRRAPSALDTKADDFSYDFNNASENEGSRRRRAASLDMKNIFASLQEKFNSIPESYKPKLQFIFQKLNSTVANLTSDANVDKLKKVAGSLQKNWGGLTGDDSAEIAKSVCDVVGTVGAMVPPPVGTVISTLMGLVSGILGMNGKKPKTMGEIVQEVMMKELKEQYKQELKGKIQGAVEALELNQVFLNGYTGGRLTDRDYHFMVSQFSFLTHMELRGGLAHFIEAQSKAKDRDDVVDTVALIDRYVTVTSMMEVLMHTMKSILEEDAETQRSAENLAKTIETARGQSRRHIQFLRNPKLENAVMAAFYDPAKHPNIEAFLDSHEITSSADFLHQNGCYVMKSKYRNMEVTVDKEKGNRLAGNDGSSRFNAVVKLGFVKSDKSWTINAPNGPVCAGGSFFYVNKCRPDMGRYRVHAFTDGGYTIINEVKGPLWMKRDAELIGISFHGSAIRNVNFVSTEETTWDKENPEFIWQLSSVPCNE